MTKFIVHIGDGKCGSSAIQAALHAGKEHLKDIGIRYDDYREGRGHNQLVTLAGKPVRGDVEKSRSLAKSVIERLREGIDETEYVVISAEPFLMMDPQEVIAILEMISDNIECIHAIAYVRDPRYMYLSLVQQMIKASSKFYRPNKYVRPIDVFVRKWEACPRVETLTVRLFDRSTLVDNNVVSDFAQVLSGLTYRNAITLENVEANSTLSAEQMVVMREFRRTLHAKRDGKHTADSGRLLSFFNRLNRGGLLGSKPALKPEASACIVSQNSHIFEWLEGQFGYKVPIDGRANVQLQNENAWPELASILAKVDEHHVQHLKRAIPGFNRDILAKDFSAAKRSVQWLSEASSGDPELIDRAARTLWVEEMRARGIRP